MLTPDQINIGLRNAFSPTIALCGWIALKKPRSRHHAGFISLIALLVLVFGILQLTSTHGP